LRGISCHPFTLNPPSKQTIACTRSFGKMITEWEDMHEVVKMYVTRTAEKMRRHGLRAAAMQVFMHTNLFNKAPPPI
jgi:DNA polymerase V